MAAATDFLTLYLATAKRVLGSLTVGALRPDARHELLRLYNVYSPPTTAAEFPEDPHILPKTDVFNLLQNDIARYEQVDDCGFGHTTEFELKVISSLVKRHQPKTIFEIGTFEGRTTLNMALNAPPDAQIYTLDLPADGLDAAKLTIEAGERAYIQKTQSGGRFLGTPSARMIQQLYGDSATFDFTPWHGKIDLVFIDASHAYDYVLNDSQRARALVRPGGLLLWHDYTNWDGVRSALNLLYKTDPAFARMQHIGGTSIAICPF
jgi:predicted O-methyltransferase YrrM